jgi:hypothetical protein
MTLVRSRSDTPLWEGWTKEFRTLILVIDDPVRYERLAAIGKNGTQFAVIKRMMFSFVHPSTWKTDTLQQKRCGFRP